MLAGSTINRRCEWRPFAAQLPTIRWGGYTRSLSVRKRSGRKWELNAEMPGLNGLASEL